MPPDSIFDPYYFPLHVALVFVLGACFGSFFNVCIYRIPRGMSIRKPDSHCYRCGQPLRWFDNVPLFTYWIRRGRCRYCGARFSSRYFLVELLTALLWTAAFVVYCNPWRGYSLVFIPAFAFVSLLVIATFTDIDHWIIPDRISLGGAVAGFIFSLIPPIASDPRNPLAGGLSELPIPAALMPPINSLVGAAAGFGGLWLVGWAGTLIFRKEAMGQGDMKLFATFGAFVGPVNCLFILFFGCLFGAAIGGYGLLMAHLKRVTPTPAVAGLTPDAARIESHLTDRDLSADERLILMRSLASPGPVGPIRHHLPFGPSLALAAAIVYLAWKPIQSEFLTFILTPPFGGF
jgi:leader peptidase (prepilin peptidase)/N-methyltransferase